MRYQLSGTKTHQGLDTAMPTISIISDDCWAGQFYQMLNLQYLTPTIGLLVDPKTYINFLSNLRNEDAFSLRFIRSTQSYPVAVTPYATIHFFHYETEEQAKSAFLRRVKRIEWSQLFVKIDFGKGGYSKKELEAWNAMKLPNSIALYPPNKFGLRPNVHNGVMIPDWIIDGAKMFDISRQHFDLFHWIDTGNVRLLNSLRPAIAHGEAFLSDTAETPATYLQRSVEKLPDGELISIQTDGSSVTQTYSELWTWSASILNGLRRAKLQPGQPIVLLLEQCQDFVAALWSCFMGGFIPISVRTSSEHSQPNQPWLKLAAALEMLDEVVILTTAAIEQLLPQQSLFTHRWSVVYLEQLETSPPDFILHPSKPDDLAALYFSSGTTGKPKLVSFSCQTILNRLLANHCENSEENFLYWLPLDHASASLRIISPDVQRKVFLPTEQFIRNPLTWLDTIEKYRITRANLTNFGMALITKSVEQSPHQRWDLASVRSIGIGAEAIVPKTYQTFLSSLTPFGLNSNAIFVGYGLTECGTVVGSNISNSLNDSISNNQFLTLGKPCQGYSIRIVDEQNSLLHEGEIGHVQIKGPATTVGYYGNAQATQSLFTEDEWVDTGDLGYIYNENLTITGRAKEIIIINAKNYSCQQIEQIVETIEGVEPTFTIACAVRTPDSVTDELAIFFHTTLSDRNSIKLINQIRVALITQLGITPTYLIPLTKAAFPRTGMGKIQRQELAKKLENGEFTMLLQSLKQLAETEQQMSFTAPQTKTEVVIAGIWSNMLQHNSISIYDNFFDLGGNSLLAARVVAAIEQQLGINLPLATFLQASTVHQLSAVIDQTGWLDFWQPLVPIQTTGDRPNLFCVHGGGLHVLVYRNLAVQMGADQPVYGLQARELNEMNSSTASIEEMASDYIHAIQTIQPGGPYFLAGLSLGGKIALEMARQLQKQGQEVALVAMFDSYGPEGLTLLPPLHQLLSTLYYVFRYSIPRLLNKHLKVKNRKPQEHFQRMSLKQGSVESAILNNLHVQKESLPESKSTHFEGSFIEEAIHNFNLLVLKHSPWNFLHKKIKLGNIARLPLGKAHRNGVIHSPTPLHPTDMYNGDVTLFLASERPPGLKTDPTLGWSHLVKGTKVFKIPGHHASIIDSPLLAKILRQCIDDAQIKEFVPVKNLNS